MKYPLEKTIKEEVFASVIKPGSWYECVEWSEVGDSFVAGKLYLGVELPNGNCFLVNKLGVCANKDLILGKFKRVESNG